MAMFVFVIDTSFMNVSISAVVEDLDTTVSGVQSAVAIEALVSTTRLGDRSAESTAPERQQICDLCRRARSVAEIAAYLRMPLGVARVLVGDMAQEGLVRVHQAHTPTDRPDLALMQRVLNGLRNL